MPVTPDQVTLSRADRDTCIVALARWDRRDPWHDSEQAHGQQLLALAYRVSLPLVPQLESPEAAAKFLRAVLAPR